MNYLLHELAKTYGWHYNKRFNLYQKVAGRVFVYVTPMIGHTMVQLYYRGAENMAFCQLELRAKDHTRIEDLFQVGEIWLQRYKSGIPDLIASDFYHISNPSGAWGIVGRQQNLHLI